MEFVNREEGLAFLEKLYKEEAFQFVVLYGRRRVGKTQLVKEFIEGKPAIYFLANSISESEQLKNLGREVGEFFNDPMKWGQS
ncbi:MAG: ATP-binding protein [Thermodesulfobacteriota bacterium]|nr:ATP-binding protein [Thermodesulfobacteriota bacterium]